MVNKENLPSLNYKRVSWLKQRVVLQAQRDRFLIPYTSQLIATVAYLTLG